jgi:molybdate transport system substrate-binding protein
VFAGAASKPALDELARRYEEVSGTRVEITFGGSGSVLTQFAQEHFGDIYIPGSDDFMDKAEQREAVAAETRTNLVYLVPVICVPKGNPKAVHSLEDLSREGTRVVIGETKSVCLGAIAQEVLEKSGLWEKTKPRIASFATSCEDTLNTLLLGESDAIIGWDVFGKQHPDKVETVAMPPELSRPRTIPAAVIKWSKQREPAERLIEFLASAESKPTWSKHGYTVEAPSGA